MNRRIDILLDALPTTWPARVPWPGAIPSDIRRLKPVVFNLNGSYDVPVIGLRVAAQYQHISGPPYAPTAQVRLPQGVRTVKIADSGTLRAPRTHLLYLNFNKFLFSSGKRRIELRANLVNTLNDEPAGYITLNQFSPSFFQPSSWNIPRQLYFGARVTF